MKLKDRRTIKRKTIIASGAAYRCESCRVWWGSQVNSRRETAFLQYIPAPVAPNLPWDEYRGWRENQAAATVCPECTVDRGELVLYIA
jgi:hypothetical protein